MDLFIPNGFRRLEGSSTLSNEELIARWSRYSKGLDEENPLHQGARNLSFDHVMMDVAYRHELNDDSLRGLMPKDFYGLPHDPRRLLSDYFQTGDIVFFWGRVFLGEGGCMRDVRSYNAHDWLRNAIRLAPNLASRSMIGKRGVVEAQTEPTVIVGSEAYVEFVKIRFSVGSVYCYAANVALELDTHHQRLEDPTLASEWDLHTRATLPDTLFDTSSPRGFSLSFAHRVNQLRRGRAHRDIPI